MPVSWLQPHTGYSHTYIIQGDLFLSMESKTSYRWGHGMIPNEREQVLKMRANMHPVSVYCTLKPVLVHKQAWSSTTEWNTRIRLHICAMTAKHMPHRGHQSTSLHPNSSPCSKPTQLSRRDRGGDLFSPLGVCYCYWGMVFPRAFLGPESELQSTIPANTNRLSVCEICDTLLNICLLI